MRYTLYVYTDAVYTDKYLEKCRKYFIIGQFLHGLQKIECRNVSFRGIGVAQLFAIHQSFTIQRDKIQG